MVELPKPTTNAVDFTLEQEIRSHIAGQNSPVEFVLIAMTGRRVLRPVQARLKATDTAESG